MTPSISKHNLEGPLTQTPSQGDTDTHIPLLFREMNIFSQPGVSEASTPGFLGFFSPKCDCLYFFAGANLYSHSPTIVRKWFCRSRPFCKAIKKEGKVFQVQAGKAWTFPAIKLGRKAFCIVKVRNAGRITTT